jgi:hypothetical protein
MAGAWREGTSAYGMGIRPWGALVRSKVRKLHGPVGLRPGSLCKKIEPAFILFGKYCLIVDQLGLKAQ